MLADDHGELPLPPLDDGAADVHVAPSVPESNGLSFESDRLLDEKFVLDSEKPLFFKQRPLFHDTGTWFFRGHWYTRQEVVAMVKKRPNNRIFATDTSSYLNTQRLTPDSDPHGYEPILAGRERIGYVASGGYGHTVEKTIVLAYLPVRYLEPGTDLVVEILGERRAARVVQQPLYDPDNQRLLS